jgi:hypothetical protein
MAQTDGKWEITVTMKLVKVVRRYSKENASPFDEKFTIEKPTLQDAIAEAIYQAKKKYSGTYQNAQVSREDSKYEFKTSKTIRNPSVTPPVTPSVAPAAPSNAPKPGTDVRGIAENIFTSVSASTEYANMIAEFKNVEKMVAKLGGVGKVFTGVSIGNDSIKLIEACIKMANTTDKNKQKEIGWELVSIAASLTRTAITIAFPPTAVIDAMFSVGGILVEQSNKALEKKMREQSSAAAVEAMKTLKAKYDKEPGHLGIVHTWYTYEVGLYCLGLSMVDIKKLRDGAVGRKSLYSKTYPTMLNNPSFMPFGVSK